MLADEAGTDGAPRADGELHAIPPLPLKLASMATRSDSEKTKGAGRITAAPVCFATSDGG